MTFKTRPYFSLQRPFRALVLGMAMLTPLLSACPSVSSPSGHSSPKDAGPSPAKAPLVGLAEVQAQEEADDKAQKEKDAKSKAENRLITYASLADTPAERIRALNQLKDNPEALAEVASTADFPDTRKMAIGALAANIETLKGTDNDDALEAALDALGEVIVTSRCRDSRMLALEVLVTHTDQVSEGELLCPALGLATGSMRAKVKLRLATLMMDDDSSSDTISDLDELSDFCLAIFSTDPAKRQRAVSKIDDPDGLEEIAVYSEYRDTRQLALEALKRLGKPAPTETNFESDISRFLECSDDTYPKASGKRHSAGR